MKNKRIICVVIGIIVLIVVIVIIAIISNKPMVIEKPIGYINVHNNGRAMGYMECWSW